MRTSDKMLQAFDAFSKGANPTKLAKDNEWISYPTAIKYYKIYCIKRILETCQVLLLTQRFAEPGYSLNSPDFEKILKILDEGTWNINKKNFAVRH